MQHYATVINAGYPALWWLDQPTDVFSLLEHYDTISYEVVRPSTLEVLPTVVGKVHRLAPLNRVLLVARRIRVRCIHNEGKDSEWIEYDPPVNVYCWTGRAEHKSRIVPHYHAQCAFLRQQPSLPCSFAPVGPQAPQRLDRALLTPSQETEATAEVKQAQAEARKAAALAYASDQIARTNAHRIKRRNGRIYGAR